VKDAKWYHLVALAAVGMANGIAAAVAARQGRWIAAYLLASIACVLVWLMFARGDE
jgi:hypothetical protein